MHLALILLAWIFQDSLYRTDALHQSLSFSVHFSCYCWSTVMAPYFSLKGKWCATDEKWVEREQVPGEKRARETQSRELLEFKQSFFCDLVPYYSSGTCSIFQCFGNVNRLKMPPDVASCASPLPQYTGKWRLRFVWKYWRLKALWVSNSCLIIWFVLL